jgi:DNA ligase D-like protein (predicted ligase)
MSIMSRELPAFIEPMLAKPGEPFDSDQYLFEIKWDGTRTLAFIETGGYRLLNRRRVDMTGRYPELDFLATLPPGTVLDGELVVMHEGKPSLAMLQSREHTRSPLRIRTLARQIPATYLVFDQLYHDYQSLMTQPLRERRELLRQTVKTCGHPRLIVSEGVVARGKAFFEETCRQGLEGMVAKRLNSRYLPGKRTDAWIKVKRRQSMYCAIIGFLPFGRDDFGSLILAAEEGGQLRCIGKVGSGFDTRLRERLNPLLWSRLIPKPVVATKLRGKWVQPGLYCRVSYLERTPNGELRAPVFEELVVKEPADGT